MNTLKLIIKNLSNKIYPTSMLEGIIKQGYVPSTEIESKDLPKDWELYSKGEERILYNGRTDEIIDRYKISVKN